MSRTTPQSGIIDYLATVFAAGAIVAAWLGLGPALFDICAAGVLLSSATSLLATRRRRVKLWLVCLNVVWLLIALLDLAIIVYLLSTAWIT